MKIELEKWTLLPGATCPRKMPHEFIRSKSKEQALEAIDYLFTKYNGGMGYKYVITVFHEGEYRTYWMSNMPCFGGLVKYKATHGEKYSMNPYFPQDIPLIFPDGDIIYIALKYGTDTVFSKKPVHAEFVFSDESPWISGFGSKDSLIFKPQYFVLTDMNTDPTVFYHLLRYSGMNNGFVISSWMYNYEDLRAHYTAYFNHMVDLRRFANSRPIKISGGTWAQGYGYTRPYNEFIFATDIPVPLSEFSGGQNNGRVVWDREYFSKVFADLGFVVKNHQEFYKKDGVKPIPEEVIMEAWNIFKKQGEELYGNA